MRYIGRSRGIPEDGWQLCELADDLLGATLDGDPNGPLIFRPTTVRLNPAETTWARASWDRFRADPAAERRQVGQFWDLWILHQDGGFGRRERPPVVRRGPPDQG